MGAGIIMFGFMIGLRLGWNAADRWLEQRRNRPIEGRIIKRH